MCGSYQDVLDRGFLLTKKLLNQWFFLVKLKWSRRKFYGRHHNLVDRYGISVLKLTTDMFHLSQTLPGPFLFHDLQELLTIPEHLSSPPVFSVVRVTRSLVDHCLLHCLFFSFGLFFDIRILITPLVSSNSSSIAQIPEQTVLYRIMHVCAVQNQDSAHKNPNLHFSTVSATIIYFFLKW
jgi:hypothetical protein